MVTNFSREAYLEFIILFRYDRSLFRKLVEDMGNKYAMGQYSYAKTLPKMQTSWPTGATALRPPLVPHLAAYISPKNTQMTREFP